VPPAASSTMRARKRIRASTRLRLGQNPQPPIVAGIQFDGLCSTHGIDLQPTWVQSVT
jgi:hypothetical protein